jgi:hypothetical protein
MKRQCLRCGVNIIAAVLGSEPNEVALCPNDLIVAALKGELKNAAEVELPCFFCGKPAIGLCVDFKMDQKADPRDVEYAACAEHLEALAMRDLHPGEVSKLRDFYGEDTFMVHDDFYDEEGNAVEPAKKLFHNRTRADAQRT